MPFHPEPDDEEPIGDDPLPPDDRLWRHPSELASGVEPPASWFEPGPGVAPADHRRALLVGAVVGACLAGALVAVGAMWLARPTRVVQGEAASSSLPPVTRATYAFRSLPTEQLAEQYRGVLPCVRVLRDGRWVAGTGVWLDDRGTVLTATPLVAGASRVLVTGVDGTARLATVTGSDAATGVTVLRVSRTSGRPLAALPAAPRSGQPVAIVSSPGAMAGRAADAAPISVAEVRAVAVVRVASTRTSVGSVVLHDSLEVDRSLPADTVGGLVVDAEGRPLGLVIGTSIEREVGVAASAGDAVAAGEDLRDDGRVQRAWLGVRAVDLDPGAATMLRLPGGAQLTAVTPGSPAAQAGLQVGDVVTAVDDQPIGDATDLVLALRDHDPGDATTVAIRRDGRATDHLVRLGG